MVSKEVGCSDEEKEAVCALVGREQHRLEFEAQPDWSWEPSLPEGWMKLTSEPTYLSPNGFIFKTKKAMVEYIMMENGEAPDYKTQEKKKSSKLTEWLDDSTVPDGWTSCSKGDGTYYKDKNGNIFRGRVEAIKSLQQQTKEGGDVELGVMLKGLEADGWKSKMHLPKGWRMRRYNKMEGVKTGNIVKKVDYRTVYLNENMEVMKTFYEVISRMKVDGLSQEDISRLKEHSWTQDQELPKGWMNKFNSVGHMTYIDNEGRYFGSLTQVARHMFVKQFPEEEIQLVRNALSNQGWEHSEYLPHGWMLRKVHHRCNPYYLSNEFIMLSKRTKVEEALDGIDDYALTRFMLNYEAIVGRPMKEIKGERTTIPKLPRAPRLTKISISNIQWEEDALLPEGWKIAPYTVLKGKYAGSQLFRCLVLLI